MSVVPDVVAGSGAPCRASEPAELKAGLLREARSTEVPAALWHGGRSLQGAGGLQGAA